MNNKPAATLEPVDVITKRLLKDMPPEVKEALEKALRKERTLPQPAGSVETRVKHGRPLHINTKGTPL